MAVVKACDPFRVYLLGREFPLRTDHAALSALFNSPISSTSRLSKWLLAVQPFRFTVTHIKGEENVAADIVSRITWPVATPKAVDVIHLAGELELDRAGDEESDSDSEEEEDEDSAQGDIILLAIELVKEQQKGDIDCHSWAQWVNSTATPTRDELQACTPYLAVLAQHLDRIAKVDEMLVIREEIDGTNRVIVPTSLIGQVIEEAHQWPGTAHESVKKVLQRLVNSYCWP